ncbi:hypothetical protein VCHA53O466_50263 [Vibrio chagasii]|nr:hypothetical protein VCHA53O466_50263 [Vibrio chagasii]
MSTQNFSKAFTRKSTDPESRYHGTEIIFENPMFNEVFEGVVEGHRSDRQLYVRVKSLRNSIQRVDIEHITAVVKYVDNLMVATQSIGRDLELSFAEHNKDYRKEFVFLPDGEPAAKLLAETKARSKLDKTKKYMGYLNDACLSRFNASYNKLLPKMKANSPFFYAGKLFLPFELTPQDTGLPCSLTYFVTIGKDAITLGDNIRTCTPKGNFFKGESLALAEVNPLEKETYDVGWVTTPYVTENGNPTVVIVKRSVNEIRVEVRSQDLPVEESLIDSAFIDLDEAVFPFVEFYKLSKHEKAEFALDELREEVGEVQNEFGMSDDSYTLAHMYGCHLRLSATMEGEDDHSAKYSVTSLDEDFTLTNEALPKLNDISFHIAYLLSR